MEFVIRLVSTHPLLFSNGRMADPTSPIARALKEIQSKRKKTDADQEEIRHLGFLGALYHDADVGPYLPGDNIERCLLDSARTSNKGKNVERGLYIMTEVNPLAYAGPRDPEELWATEHFRFTKLVKTARNARVLTSRPIFRQWSCEARGYLDEGQLNASDLPSIAENAGIYIGVGSWRPKFGRFTAEVEKV